jgi:hypothetical protein
MPGPFIPIVMGAYILTAATGGPPKIDAQATCKATESIITGLFGDQTMATVENCLRQENEALAQIKKDWATYSASEKALCAQPKAYMPNYVEWVTCFEMFRDVRKLREEAPKAATATPTGRVRQPRPMQ